MRIAIIIGSSPQAFDNKIHELMPEIRNLGFEIETKEGDVTWGYREETRGSRQAHVITNLKLSRADLIIDVYDAFAFNSPPNVKKIKDVDLVLLVGYCIAFTDGIKIKDLCLPDKFTMFNYREKTFEKPRRLDNVLISKKFLDKFNDKKHIHLHCLTSPFELYKAIPEMNPDEKDYFEKLYERYDIGEMESAFIADFARSNKKRFGEVLLCSDDKKTSIAEIIKKLKNYMKKAVKKVTDEDIDLVGYSSYVRYINNHPKSKEIWATYERNNFSEAEIAFDELDINKLMLTLIKSLMLGEI